MYDPETGRFLQPDPVHNETAGIDSYDRYSYVSGNPVNFTDPTGESAVSQSVLHIKKMNVGQSLERMAFISKERANWLGNRFKGVSWHNTFHHFHYSTMDIITGYLVLTGALCQGATDSSYCGVLSYMAYVHKRRIQERKHKSRHDPFFKWEHNPSQGGTGKIIDFGSGDNTADASFPVGSASDEDLYFAIAEGKLNYSPDSPNDDINDIRKTLLWYYFRDAGDAP